MTIDESEVLSSNPRQSEHLFVNVMARRGGGGAAAPAHARTDSPREPIDAPTAAVDRLPTLRRAARGQLARTGSFLLAAMSSCWRISLALVLSLVLLAPPCDAKVAKLDANSFAMAVNHPSANSIVMFHAPW